MAGGVEYRSEKMGRALKAARRLLISERRELFNCFTIAPDRSYDQMNVDERRCIKRFDRAIAMIGEALR